MDSTRSTHGVTVSLTLGQKVVAGVTVGVLLLMVGMLFDNRTSIQDLKADNGMLQLEIRHLREIIEQQMDDRYRGSDARRDMQLRDQAVSSLRAEFNALRAIVEKHHQIEGHPVMVKRVEGLERRVEKLEGR